MMGNIIQVFKGIKEKIDFKNTQKSAFRKVHTFFSRYPTIAWMVLSKMNDKEVNNKGQIPTFSGLIR